MTTDDPKLVLIESLAKEGRVDIYFMIAYFRLPQPFKVRTQSVFNWVGSDYGLLLSSTVRIKGRKISLCRTRMEQHSGVEDFLQVAISSFIRKTS